MYYMLIKKKKKIKNINAILGFLTKIAPLGCKNCKM